MAEDLKKLVEKGVSRGYSLEKIQSDFANAGWGEAYLNNIPVYYNELKKKSPVGPKGAGVLPSRQGDTRFSSESQLQQDKYAGVGNVPLSDPLLKKKDGLADSLFKIINQSQKDADNANKYVPQIQKLWNDYSSIERGQKETQNIFDERGRINRLALSSLNASAKRNSDRVKEEAKAIAKDDGVLETAARGFYGGILGAADYVANLFDPDTYDDQPDAPDSLGLEAKRQLERAQKASLGRKLSAGYTEKQIEDGFIGNFANGNYGAAFDLFGRDLVEVLPQNAVGFIPYVGLPLMAASAGGQGWQAVKDDDKYSTLEKFIYAPLVGTAEYVTEKLFGMDRKMVQKGLSQAFGKTIKSGADIPKKELGDMLFGGIPKAVRAPLEEGLEEGIVSTFTQTLDKIMAGKPFDPVEIAESVMLGAGAGGSTYALVRGGSALLQTPVFNDVYTITNNVNKINELLKSEDIVPEEKEILSNRLNQFKTQLNQLRNEASDYYKPFSKEDKQRTLELNQAITKGMRTYGAMKTPEAKAEVVNTIRQSLAEKAQIEQKYDSTQKQQVPSPVVQGAQPGGVPIQGTSAEAPQAGGVLQVPSQQEEEIVKKTREVEASTPSVSAKPVSTTLNENNYQGIIGSVRQYVDNLSDNLFDTLGTSRQQVMNGVDSIANVLSSFAKSNRQIPITIYATEEAWKRGTGEQDVSRGMYVEGKVEGQPTKISIFLPALVGNTVYHEGLHDVVPKVFGVEGINKVSKALSEAILQDPTLATSLGNFASNYKKTERAEEFLVELASRVSSGDIDIEVTKSLATRFMEAIAKVLGVAGIKMNPSSAQLSKALVEYAQRLGAGVALEEKPFDVKGGEKESPFFGKRFQEYVSEIRKRKGLDDTQEAEDEEGVSRQALGEIPEIFDTEELNEMANGDIESEPFIETEIVAPTNVKRQDIVFPESGTYPVSKITKSDVKDIESFLKEQVKLGKNFAFWYADQFGRGNYVDPYTGEEYFLDGGPSFPFDPENKKNGDVWATGYKTPMALYKEFVTGKKGKKRPDFIVQISGHPRRMMFFNKTVNKIWIERARAKYKDIDLLKKELTSISNIKGISFFVKNTTSWEQMLSDLDSNESVVIDGKTKTKSDVIKKAIGFVKEINPKPLGKKGEIATSTKLYNLLVENGLHPDNFDNLRDGFFKEYDFNEGEILCIYKATDIVPNANTHGTYAHSIKGEPVLVPDAKVSAWGLMPEEVRRKRKTKTDKETGEKILGKELKDLPKSAIQKAMAPDYPTVYSVTKDEKQLKKAITKLSRKLPKAQRITESSEKLEKLFRRDGIALTKEEAAEILTEVDSWRDWYDGISSLVEEVFGEYAADYMMFMFGSAMAANSASTIGGSINNLDRFYKEEALKGLPLVKQNIYRSMLGLEVNSRKIQQFINAGLGDKNAKPIDMHVWSFMNSFSKTKNPNEVQFKKGLDFVDDVAEVLGWDPREVQATMWAANILRLGGKPDTYEEYIRRKVDKGLNKTIQGWRNKGIKPVFKIVKDGERLKTEYAKEVDREALEGNLEDINQKIAQAIEERRLKAKQAKKETIITSLSERFKGDKLLDLQDTLDELLTSLADVDAEGNVTLYHRTTKENKSQIQKSGQMKGEEDGLFFSTTKDGQAEGYGEAVVKLKVPIEDIQIDDLFEAEAHVRIPTSKAGQIVDVSEYLEKAKPKKPKVKFQLPLLEEESSTTQVATTIGSYAKAANIAKRLGAKNILDYGAGLGLGSDAMRNVVSNVDSFEPFPERWKGKVPPTYTDNTDIEKKYDAVVSLNVLNVVRKDLRDAIVKDIFSLLNDNGAAIISTRAFKGDIAKAKNFENGPEDKSYIIKRKQDGKVIDVFQKGFDGNELVDYLQELLGDEAIVRKDNSYGAAGAIITKSPKAKRMAIVPSELRETPSQIDDRAGELLLDLFKGTKYFDRVKSIKRQLIIDPESRKKYEKALGEKDGRALYGILGNQDSEKAIAFAKEKFPIKGSLAAMADRMYKNDELEIINFGSTVIYGEYQKYLNKELKDIVNKSTLDPKDLLREVGYELFNPKNLTEARESFLHFYEKGQNICTLNMGSARFQQSFVTFIVKDDAAITPMADKLTQDNLTKDWKDYLEKKGRKNADGTYNLKGLERDSLDPYSTSVVSLQINKSNGDVKEISRYNHQIGSPDNIFSRDFNKIIDGLEDAMFKKFGVDKNTKQSKNRMPYGIIQDTDGRFFNYIYEENGVYYGDGFYLEGGVTTLLDKNSQRMVDGFVINANGKVESVTNRAQPFLYGDVLKVNYIKGNEISLTTRNGNFVFEVKNGAVVKLIDFPKEWRKRELKLIANYSYDSEGNIVIEKIDFPRDFQKYINMLWADDIVGFNDTAVFDRSKVQSLGELRYIRGNAYFRGSQIKSLGKLMYINGVAWFAGSQIESLGELRYIGNIADFGNSQVKSIGKLRYIGGSVDFDETQIQSLGELRYIGSSANFGNSQIQSLGKLRYIAKGIDSGQVQSLGDLRYIGGHAYFEGIQDKSLGELRYIGRNIDFGSDNQIQSLGELRYLGAEYYPGDISYISEALEQQLSSIFKSSTSELGDEYRNEFEKEKEKYFELSEKVKNLIRESSSSSEIEKAILEIDKIGDTKPEVKLQKIAKAQDSQLEAQMYDYLLSISEKKSDKTYKLPFTLDEFISFMSPAFSRQRATEIYKNVSKGVTQGKIDDAYEASRKLLDAEKNKKMFTWDAARKFFLDRQATLKAAILKAGMKNAYNLLVNRAGSGARANYFFSKQEKAIYDGLSSKDIEALDKIIMLRRIAEIDRNFDARGESRPIHPSRLNFESAQLGLAEKRKELGSAKFNELNDRADKYFDAFKSLLDSMYDEGLVSEDLYNRLKNLDYQPRMFLEHVFDMDELSMRDINLSANQVKRIKDGSGDEIMFDSRFLLAVYSKSTFSRIARNKVNRAIAEATSVNGNEEWISKDPKKQFSEVTYFEDGVRKQFYIKSSLKGELDDVQRFGAIPPESQKYVGLLSGSYLLKLLATRANPLFVFRNIPRDYLHVLFFTNVYDNMNMPLAMYRLAGDAIKGVKGKIKDDQDYKDFIEYGGGMEYLSTEGKEGMMTNRSLLNRTIEKLGSAGELSEIAFRLGMYKRLVQESLKNFYGTPTEEQLAQIKVEAVTKSREMIDFAQGGVATKTLESAVPYINAAFQGFRVSSAYIKNNPKEFVIKLGQLAIGLAVIAMYNAVMGDDDMEDIPEDVKRKYFIIMTPFTEEKDGKTVRKYIKIAKTQQLIPFISSLDMSLEGNLIAPFMGREPRFNEDTIKQSWDAFLSYFPKDPTKPLDEALSSVPLFSALAAYKMNYDTYRKRIVSTDYQDKNVLPAYEDFSDKNVPYFYKAIGQAVDAGPKRLQVATEKFITTPYSSLITMGGYTLMDAIASNVYEVKGPGGYTPAEQEAISNKALKSAGINVEKIFIGTTDPDHKIYNKREQIERINLEASTERRGLKLQAKELGGKYFTAKEQGDAKGMNEALEAIKNARIEVRNKAVEEKNKQDYDYFNDALKTNMRFGPTFPQEYNDITFATDNEARAKIIAIRDMNMTQKELIDYLVDYKRKTGKSIDIRTIIREYDKFVTNEKK